MKYSIIGTLMLLFSASFSYAQPAGFPESASIQPFTLSIGFNKTTVLIFPAMIKDADKGQKDVIVSRQKGVENVLKLKAARKGFEATNLHVFTTDGRLYAFDIRYDEPDGSSTYDLSDLPATECTTNAAMPLIMPELEEAPPALGLQLCQVKSARPFFRAATNKNKLRLQLRSIHFDKDRLYFRYRVDNRSSIPYVIDFTRMYISDGRRVKRSSSQQQELTPDFASGEKLVTGRSSVDFVFILKRFTIPDAKKFKIEFYEKNGGRNIALQVRNRHIFKAQPLF